MRKLVLNCAFISLLTTGNSIPARCFLASTDSIDVNIEKALDAIYEELYFEDYDRASKAMDDQARIAKDAGRWHLVVSAMTLKAECAYNFYMADKTYETLLAVEALAEKYKEALDTLDPVKVYRSKISYVRGMHFHELGDFSRAIASFDKIIDNHRRYRGIDPQYLYGVHSFIGHSYLQLLMYDRAYLNYEQAYAYLLPEKGENAEYGRAMINLLKGQCKENKAKAQDDKKMVAEALTLYKQALRTLIKWKDKVSYRGALTSVYSSLASVCDASGKYDSALYYLNASLQFHGEKDPVRVLTYDDMADIYVKKNKYEMAILLYDKSIRLAETSYVGNHYMKSVPLFKKAELLLTKKDFHNALSTCQAGLAQLLPNPGQVADLYSIPSIQQAEESNIDLLLDGLSLKGKIHFSRYQQNKQPNELTTSLSCYQTSINIIEGAQKKFPDAEFKQNLAAKKQSLYEGALEANFAAFENNDPEQAAVLFRLMEANKSTMLRDAVQDTYAQQYLGVPSALLEKESYLKGSMASGRAKLYTNPGDTAVAQWKKELYEMTVVYDSLIAVIKKDHRDYYEAKYADQMMTLDQVKTSLDPGTLLIEYFWGERSVYVLGLSRDKVVVKKMGLSQEKVASVTKLIKTITQGESSVRTNDIAQFRILAYSVYQEMLHPIIRECGSGSVKSLVIVADGILTYLPFEILLTADPTLMSNYKDLPYLLRDYSVRGLFLASQLKPRVESKEFQYQYLGFAPSYSVGQRNESIPERSVPLQLKPLNFNVEEVTEAASFFNGKVFLGNTATEGIFKSESNHGRVIHLSMHGFADDDQPSFSGLAFSKVDTLAYNGPGNDGFLFLHELYNVSLRADLAVLSACETGLGKYQRGEGILSLGKAFRYAGCENIVMSLWKVNDRSTADIMKAFFTNLSNGMNKDEALKQAKLTFLGNSRNKYFTHPYYWSAFVLTGDTAPVFTGGSSYRFYALAGLFVAVALLITMYRSLWKGLRNPKIPEI